MQEKQTSSQNNSRYYLHLNQPTRKALFATISAILYMCLTIFIINVQIIHPPIASAESFQEFSTPTEKITEKITGEIVDTLNRATQDGDSTLGLDNADPSFIFRATLNGYRSDTPPGPYLLAGRIVTWTYTITNTGNVAFNNIIVTNQFSGAIDSNDNIVPTFVGDDDDNGLLDVGEVWIFRWRQTVGNDTYIAKPIISADPANDLNTPIPGPDGQPLPTVTATDRLYYVGVRPAIKLTIQPNNLSAGTLPGPAIVVAEPMTWTYVITNSGTMPLSNIRLEDDTYGTIDTQFEGDSNSNGLLDIDEQWLYEIGEVTVTGQQTRTAQISAEPSDPNDILFLGFNDMPFATVTATAEGYYFGVDPSLSMNYYAGDLREDIDEGAAYMAPDGEDIRYTFLVENSGDIALVNLIIQDNNGTVDDRSDDFLLSDTQCSALAGPLLPGETTLCRLQKNIVYSDTIHTSQATVTGTPIGADDQPLANISWPIAQDEATVVQIIPGLQLEHTLYAGYDNGSSCPGQSELFFTGTTTVTHCYLVTNSGNVHLDKIQLFDDRGNFLFAHDPLLGPAQSVEFFIERAVDASISVTTTAVGKPSDMDGVPYAGLGPIIATNTIQIHQEEISVGGTVWYDDDGNGQLNEFTDETALDVGVAEIVVYLLDGLTGDKVLGADGKPLQSVTENDGRYRFEKLHAGDYVVEFDLATLPSGYKPTISDRDDPTSQSKVDPVTGQTSRTGILFGGEEEHTRHLGIITGVQVGGQVWVDNDQDGLQDDGEAALIEVQIVLLDSDTGQPILRTDGTAITAQTDEQGRYLFSALPAGKYAVRIDLETLPTDNLLLYDSSEPATVGILSGSQRDLTLDFALMDTFQLSGQVWYDNNDNGIQDIPQEEQGILDVAVILLDGDTGQPLQIEKGVPITTRTDIDGRYLFENLPLGSYAVQFDLDTLPTNHLPTIRDVNNDIQDSDGDPITGRTMAIEFRSDGPKNATLDLGIMRPDDSSDEPPSLPATLGDTVWFDLDHDGILDDDESGIEGITMQLYDEEDFLVRITKTSASGFYLFTDITPGNYRIQCIQRLGYYISPQNVGDDSKVDSDVDPDSCRTPLISLASADYADGWDVGLYTLDNSGVISNQVWFDINQNGRKDSGESGVSGVLVDLYNTQNELLWTVRTDSNGRYRFYDLPHGTYYIEFLPAAEYVSTLPARSETSRRIRTPIISLNETINQESGATLGLHLNGVTPASLGSQVWHDLNLDGLRAEDEPGLPNVLVKLYDDNERISATATTDEEGRYLFQGLVPKTYKLEFASPAGYQPSMMNDDTNLERVDELTFRTVEITLDSDVNGLILEAGFMASPTDLSVSPEMEFVNLYLPLIYKP